MTAKAACLALTCVSMVAGATHANAEPKWHDAPQSAARLLAVKTAECIVAHQSDTVLKVLDAPFGDETSAARFVTLQSRECLDAIIKPTFPTGPSQLHQPLLLMRGNLFQALFKRDFGKAGLVSSFASVGPITYPVSTAPDFHTMEHDYRAFMKIGDCMVRVDAIKARALMDSLIGSRGETQALAAFDPLWAQCGPGGKKLTFSPDVMRGTIAEPLYRLTQARQAADAQIAGMN